MAKSESIKELAAALSKAQAQLKPAAMNATNPFLKNRYADLGAVIEAARPVLEANGLAVVTHAENERHKREHGTLTVMAGERNGNAKLTAAEVAEIRRLSRAGLPQTAIAAVFGVGQGSVSKIVNGQMWRCDYAKESR